MDPTWEPLVDEVEEEASKQKKGLDVPPPNWGTDERISFSKESGKYLLEDEDGSEMEWNTRVRAWMPVVRSINQPRWLQFDEDELSAQQSAYSVEGVDSSVPIERRKKRKKKDVDYATHKRKTPEERDEKPKRERKITSVYISNLPLDVSLAEIQEYFAKCGVIAEDASGKKRVKMYCDENGNFKGDALVTYFKPESVPLALQLLDETELPRADSQPSPGLIRVQLVGPLCHLC